MLSKKTFVEAMNAIVKHREIMDELKIPLRKLGEFPFSLDIESMHREALLKVLREVTGDDSDWITWWLYEDGNKVVEWEEAGSEMSADLSKVEALYDFLLSNIEHASVQTLPITILKEDEAGNPRAYIEEYNFLLYFNACLKYIDEANATLIVCEDIKPKYAVIPFREEAAAAECGCRNIWHISCPGCGQLMEVKILTQRNDLDGVDLIAHCPNCHLDWNGHIDKFGALQTLERHYWG